jgi:3-methyladenine DNA glycosylase AlkD
MKAAGFNNATKLADEIAAKIRTLSSVKTEPVRAVRRTYSKQLAEAPAPYVIDVATRLLQKHDINRFVAYELLKHHRAAAASVRTSDLEKFGRGLNQWGDVDCFACFLSGPAWREHQISDKVVHRWAHSKDRWWRRVALVSTVPLNSRAQGGRGDTERTIEVCRLLVSDRDDMVVKAMSWALRVLSKHDSKSVTRFLIEHRDVVAARVVREVGNKLSTGLKTPRRAPGLAAVRDRAFDQGEKCFKD